MSATKTTSDFPTVTLHPEDVETILFGVLHGRHRLRELGEQVDDEYAVDDLAVAARVLWDALPEHWRDGFFEDFSIGRATRDELKHVLGTRLNDKLQMETDPKWRER